MSLSIPESPVCVPESAPREAFDPLEIATLDKRYRLKRRRWMRSIGWSYADDDLTPDPAILDGADPEEG